MNSKNIVKNGINQSVDVINQSNDSMRMNYNGRFIHIDKGSLRWMNNIKNSAITLLYESVIFEDSILGFGKINDRLLVFTTNGPGEDSIGEILFDEDSDTDATFVSIIYHEDLGFSIDYPILDFFSVYESETVQRIYWNDTNMPPRSLNIVNVPDPFNVEMLNFTPPYNKGEMRYINEVSGNLLCGTYFYTFRLISSDGAVTDYQNFTNGINVAPKLMGSYKTKAGYQDYQGDASSQTSNTGNRFYLTDIDTRYKEIQIVAFRSTDYNISENGVIIAKLEISGSSMYFEHTGSENLGSISINDVIITTRYINKIASMDVMKNKNSICNFDERAEIEETDIIDNYKISGVELDKAKVPIPSDIVGLPYLPWRSDVNTDEEKPVHAIPITHSYQLKNQWYLNTTTGSYILGDGITAKPSNYIPYLRIEKYTQADGTIIYENTALDDEFLDYKGKMVSERLRTYRGQETYRIGLLPIDKATGKALGVRWIGDREIPIRSGFWNMVDEYLDTDGYAYDQTNLNIIKIIVNNLDISDLVTTDSSGNAIDCKISGFHIVRAPLDEQVISEGVLLPVLDSDTDGSRRGLLPWVGCFSNYDLRQRNLYQYHSPELLFEQGDQSVNSSDVLKLVTYLGARNTDDDGRGRAIIDGTDWVNKYIWDSTRPSTTLPLVDSERTISAYYDLEFYLDGREIAIPEVGLIIKNETRFYERDGNGDKSRLFVTNETETNLEDSFAAMVESKLSYVSHLRKKSNLYGGTDDAALAATNYISTGHYQEVTNDILNSIKQTDGSFVFNGIDVFGGDCYMSMFDLERIVKYHRGGTGYMSHAILFPVCSKINLALRTGIHVAKDRAYDPDYNIEGIGVRSGIYNLEEFNCNEAYSTNNIGQYFNPLPYGFSPKTKSPMQIAYTGTKIIGETVDSYRIFPSNNIKTVDSTFGPIMLIRALKDYMLYWQKDGMGYLPMNERVMTNNVENQPVQLGIGGVYDRYDTKTKFYGCQHPFSIIETEFGYAWFDLRRKAFLYLTNSLNLTDDSIIKGLEPFLETNLDSNLIGYNVPSDTDKYGIISYYDQNQKEVIMSFKQPSEIDFSIVFSERVKQFTAVYEFVSLYGIFFNQKMYSTSPGKNKVYLHEVGTNGLVYDEKKSARVSFIVNKPNDISKIFDNMKVIGNNNFFNSIKFKNEHIGEVEENFVDLSNINISKYLKYRNQEWLFSLPFDNDGARIRGHYLEIEFIVDEDNSNLVELVQFITTSRKAY